MRLIEYVKGRFVIDGNYTTLTISLEAVATAKSFPGFDEVLVKTIVDEIGIMTSHPCTSDEMSQIKTIVDEVSSKF